MCWVGYVHFACGHNKIYTTDCAYAKEQSLWQRVACIDYTEDSTYPPYFCGLGKFYCLNTKDGPFFDHVVEGGRNAQATMIQIDSQLPRIKAAAEQFVYQANQRGITQTDWKDMPEFLRLRENHAELIQRRKAVQKTLLDANEIMQGAQEWNRRREEHLMSGDGSVFPPYVPRPDIVGRIPAELQLQPVQNMDVPQSIDPTGYSGPSLQTEYGAQAGVQSSRPSGTITQPQQFQIPSGGYNPSLLPQAYNMMQAQQAGVDRQKMQHTQQLPSTYEPRSYGTLGQPNQPMFEGETATPAPRRRGRKSAARKQEEEREEAERVRRSARVRGKKVNYAESPGSSAASREPSPGKSDVSGLSPLKSDDSRSPVKNRRFGGREIKLGAGSATELERTGSSLAEKISDYNMRSTMGQGLPMQQRQISVKKELLDSSPAQPTPPPDTRVLSGERSVNRASSSRPQPLQYGSISSALNATGTPQPYEFAALTALQSQSHIQAWAKAQMQSRPQTPMQMPMHAASPYHVTSTAHNQSRQHSEAPGYGSQTPNSFDQQSLSLTQSNVSQGGQGRPTPALGTYYLTPSYKFPPISSWTGGLAIPTATPDSPANASDALGSTRRDSVMTPDKAARDHAEQTPAKSSYDYMRRSFGSAAALTPPDVQPHASTSTEPAKREVPPSSPTLPPSKRVRLSLPGQEVSQSASEFDSALAQGPGTSALLNAPSPGPLIDEQALGPSSENKNEDEAAVPAPMLEPAAVMIPHTDFEETANNAGATDSAELPQQQEEDGTLDTDFPGAFLSDDFDFGVEYDGLFGA